MSEISADKLSGKTDEEYVELPTGSFDESTFEIFEDENDNDRKKVRAKNVVLESPNGTRWVLSVDDQGELSAEEL